MLLSIIQRGILKGKNDILRGVSELAISSKIKRMNKPIIVMLISLLMFTTTVGATSAIHTYASTDGQSDVLHANWITDSIDWAKDTVDGLFNSGKIAEAIADEDYDGVISYIAPDSYAIDGKGVYSEGAPFSGIGDDEENEENEEGEFVGSDGANEFLAFQYWASQYGVSSFSGMSEWFMVAAKQMGRFFGGAVLLAVTVLGHVTEFIGEMVYSAIDAFNIFSYVLPDAGAGDLLTEWTYTEDSNPIVAYFGDWINIGRYVGYFAAILIFVVGLGLSVLGYRMGKANSMGGSILGTFKRLVISVFALTGALFMLSGIITMFGDEMQASGDELSMDNQISGLILNYKDFVTGSYMVGHEDVNKNMRPFQADIPSLDAVVGLYESSDGKGTGTTITENASIRPGEIEAINATVGYGSEESTGSGSEALTEFTESNAYEMITGWMFGNSTTSSQIAATYGEETIPTAFYRVKTNDSGEMSVENRGFLSTEYGYFDFTIPGGMIGFLRGVYLVIQTALLVVFAWNVYKNMFFSILTMAQRVIVQLPATAMLGSGSSLFLMFGAVIVMILELVIGRATITLFKDVLGAADVIFPVLENLSTSGTAVSMFPMGVITPLATAAETSTTLPMSEVLLSTLVSAIAGILAYKGFTKLIGNLGSSIDNFFVDLAGRISGVRPDAQRGTGGSALMTADGEDGGTSSASEDIVASGDFSESEAEQMGLAGNTIGGINSGSNYGDGDPTDYTPGDEDAVYDDDNVTSESALAKSHSSEEDIQEAPMGSVGSEEGVDGSVEGEVGTEEESVTTGSYESGSMVSDSGVDGESALTDEAGEMSGMADTASDRTHTDDVSMEQDVAQEDMDSLGAVAEGSDDESLDNNRTISGVDYVLADSDQVVDDMSEANDGTFDEMANDSTEDIAGSESTLAVGADEVSTEYDDNAQEVNDVAAASAGAGAAYGAVGMSRANEQPIEDQTIDDANAVSDMSDDTQISSESQSDVEQDHSQTVNDDVSYDTEYGVEDGTTQMDEDVSYQEGMDTASVGSAGVAAANMNGDMSDTHTEGQESISSDVDALHDQTVDSIVDADVEQSAIQGSEQVNESLSESELSGDENGALYMASGSNPVSDTTSSAYDTTAQSSVSDGYDVSVDEEVAVDSEGKVSHTQSVQQGSTNDNVMSNINDDTQDAGYSVQSGVGTAVSGSDESYADTSSETLSQDVSRDQTDDYIVDTTVSGDRSSQTFGRVSDATTSSANQMSAVGNVTDTSDSGYVVSSDTGATEDTYSADYRSGNVTQASSPMEYNATYGSSGGYGTQGSSVNTDASSYDSTSTGSTNTSTSNASDLSASGAQNRVVPSEVYRESVNPDVSHETSEVVTEYSQDSTDRMSGLFGNTGEFDDPSESKTGYDVSISSDDTPKFGRRN